MNSSLEESKARCALELLDSDPYIQHVWEKIQELDLTLVKKRLMRSGWSNDQANTVELLYKMFLFLAFKFPDDSLHMIVPTDSIDEFWHAHILDTVAYANDCQVVFGAFLHHQPDDPDISQEDQLMFQKGLEDTKALFVQFFNIDLSIMP